MEELKRLWWLMSDGIGGLDESLRLSEVWDELNVLIGETAAKEEVKSNSKDFDNINRIEVVDGSGRVFFANYPLDSKVKIQLQDDNETLKLFVNEKAISFEEFTEALIKKGKELNINVDVITLPKDNPSCGYEVGEDVWAVKNLFEQNYKNKLSKD